VEPEEARNLLDEHKNGRMWEHEEGRKLLLAMLDLGLAMHNNGGSLTSSEAKEGGRGAGGGVGGALAGSGNSGNRSKDAIKTFQEMIAMDPADHLV
jgi:hypothetical protein